MHNTTGSNAAVRVALFGYPLAHSVSPAMHHAAAATLGVSLRYELWPLDGEALPAAIAALRGREWLGANVTLPHKLDALRLADDASPLALRIGAANTLYKRDRRLLAENTDAPALVRALQEQLRFAAARERVLLLGAGGAARAAVIALLDAGVPSLAIWNRSQERAAALLASLGGLDREITVVPTAELESTVRAATLLVNATSVGLDGSSTPLDVRLLPRGQRVYDLVYGPDGTPLVRAAREGGVQAVDGLWMLVYQAAAAFQLWTGLEPPAAIMHAAALVALRARGRNGAAVAAVEPAQ